MIVKKVISEELLTIAEVKEILNRVKESRSEEGVELDYELRRTISHVNAFTKTKDNKSKELVNQLLKLDKMDPHIAIKIADIMPLSSDEVRSIYAKERYTLTKEDIEKILELVTNTL
ncbi:MAG: RNA polymerase Rpb4 family protein [Methanosarcinales archaeon]